MFSTLVDLHYALQAAIRARLPWIARAWRDGIPGALLCVTYMSPVWSTVNVGGVPFNDAARVADRELLLNDMGLRLMFVIKGYVASLYLPEHAKNTTVVLGMKDLKRLQIHPSRNMGADTFIHALNDSIHRNQTEIQMQKLTDRLTQLEDAMYQIGSTKCGDAINFDHAPDASTTISISGVAHAKAIPGEDFYQAMLGIFIGNNPVDHGLKDGLLGS